MRSVTNIDRLYLFFVTEASVRTVFFFFQAEDGIRDYKVTGVQTCALPIFTPGDGQTVGVGAPIVFRFKAPVANKAAVLQAIDVTMSNPVPAAWRWFGAREDRKSVV